MVEKLIIYQKAYESYKYSFNMLKNFPKSEKFTLASEINSNYYQIFRLIIRANRKKVKSFELFEIDTELKILQLNIRLSFELQFMNDKQYEIISKHLEEIGRILGGWIKSTG